MLAWCADAHDVYFEDNPILAGAGVNPNIVGARAPLLNARHEDGLGETPARAERILHFHACVVCVGEHDVCFEDSPAEPSPRALGSALPSPIGPPRRRLGEGTGRAASESTLCRPKAFRLVSIEALGRSARCILVLRGVRKRT